MTIDRIVRRTIAAAALGAGLAMGLAATVGAQPQTEEDFLQCLVDHQDSDGIGVCCVFYGGDYDERTQECWIDWSTLEQAQDVRPTTPTKPLHTVPRAPISGVATR